jgi:hypothetical protein
MPKLFTMSEVAHQLDTSPKSIADLLWQGKLSEGLFIKVGGRRLVPEESISPIASAIAAVRSRRQRAGVPSRETVVTA